jgi:hypothetical protein
MIAHLRSRIYLVLESSFETEECPIGVYQYISRHGCISREIYSIFDCCIIVEDCLQRAVTVGLTACLWIRWLERIQDLILF